MEYLFLTDVDRQEAAARAIAGREEEYMSYEINRVNYEQILATFTDLSEAWPPELEPFKKVFGEELAAKVANDTQYALVARYQHRDRIKVLLRTNNAQRDIGKKSYDALLLHLPANSTEKQALLDKIKAERLAAKNKGVK